MPARGSAEWKGDVPTGTGTFTAGDTISGGYTFKSRFEDGPGSNPEQLIAAAYPEPTFVDSRTMDTHIKRMRRKFEAIDPGFSGIEAVPGLGYRSVLP